MNKEKLKKYLELINQYQLELNKINLEIKKYDNKYQSIFNKELLNLNLESEIYGIVVMDNPGKEEKEQSKYLVGKAGKIFNNIIKDIGLERENFIILNKTSISTNSTSDLNKIIENENLFEIFKKEQEITFQFIKEISNLLEKPILLHGFSQYIREDKIITTKAKTRPLYIFFKNLERDKKILSKTHFYNHTSFGGLSKQIKNYKIENNLKNIDFREYLKMGEKKLICNTRTSNKLFS